MNTLPFLMQLHRRVLAMKYRTSTSRSAAVFENIDASLREIYDAMLEEAHRTDTTLDISKGRICV